MFLLAEPHLSCLTPPTQVLVGNKADMPDEKRAVPFSKGQALADEYNIKVRGTQLAIQPHAGLHKAVHPPPLPLRPKPFACSPGLLAGCHPCSIVESSRQCTQGWLRPLLSRTHSLSPHGQLCGAAQQQLIADGIQRPLSVNRLS